MAILRRRCARFVRWTILPALLATASLAAAPPGVAENDIKAAFLYNFAKYVEWPDASPSDPFRLCVSADAAFLKSVDDIIVGETIAGRAITRQLPSTPEAARACDILFVGGADVRRAESLLGAVRGAHVLTVGDGVDFLTRGGIVAFVRDGNRVRFDVNLAEAQGAGLTISSRLLRVARRVSSPAEPGR